MDKVSWKFKDSTHSVLFIFYTSKHYQKGFGCYNLDCAAFIQTDNSWKLGGEFPKYSVSGGEQHWLSMEWYLVPDQKGKKNWQLLLKGILMRRPSGSGIIRRKVLMAG